MAGQHTPAVTALRRLRLPLQVHDLGEDGVPNDDRGYGLAAAAAMDVDASRILKTILVADSSDPGKIAVAIVPVTTTVDLKAAAKALGIKRATVAKPADAERVTGYVVGGISPLGQRRRLPTLLDTSALGHTTVYVSGGRRGLEIELAPADLVTATDARVVDIAR